MTNPKPPVTPILSVPCRMLRSPSHESVTTNLSSFSVSSLASDALLARHRNVSFKDQRGSSPNPDHKSLQLNRHEDIPEIMWYEESNVLIRRCAALSTALGLQKSFSTGDIVQLQYPELQPNQLQHSMSEMALNSIQRYGYMMDYLRLEHTSRSCSTWVAVGELATASQLPSPHGGAAGTGNSTGNNQYNNILLPPSTSTPPPPFQPAFTPADLICSVNKKVRQNYIRRRLLKTYRALERLSQSEFNLDRLEAVAIAAIAGANTIMYSGPGPTELIVPSAAETTTIDTTTMTTSTACGSIMLCKDQKEIENFPLPILSTKSDSTASTSVAHQHKPEATTKTTTTTKSSIQHHIVQDTNGNKHRGIYTHLTMNDIDLEPGKPLSKYDRNMMIFNWLHTLEEEGTTEDEDM